MLSAFCHQDSYTPFSSTDPLADLTLDLWISYSSRSELSHVKETTSTVSSGVVFFPFTTGTQYSLNGVAASVLYQAFHPSWQAAPKGPQIFLTDQQRGNTAPQK